MANLPTGKSKKNTPLSDNFLEALRSLSSDVTQTASRQLGDFTSDMWGQLNGTQSDHPVSPYPNSPSYDQFSDYGQQAESPQPYKRQVFFERQKSAQEKIVFSKADQQTKLQIQSIQEELKKLAASTQNLATEIQSAVMQSPVNPGVYHVGFFEKLRLTIIAIKKRVEESASWLHTLNSKSKKQGYYWSQVGKSGSKYLLSQERYMQTSAG